jgi:hypothetical protein
MRVLLFKYTYDDDVLDYWVPMGEGELIETAGTWFKIKMKDEGKWYNKTWHKYEEIIPFEVK